MPSWRTSAIMMCAKSWQTPRRASQRVVDRRIDARALRAVLEALVDLARQIAAASRADRRRASRPISRASSSSSARAVARTGSGCSESQNSPDAVERVELLPGVRRRARRAAAAAARTRRALRPSTVSRAVPAGNVEVMDDVAVVILVHHARATPASCVSSKLRQRCVAVAARLHAHFHHALADRRCRR